MRASVGLAALLVVGCAPDEPVGHVPAATCPDRMVHLSAVGACIDRFEAATEGRGAAEVAVPAEGRLPRVDITWAHARRACENAGYRLCTEDEFTVACSGALPGDEAGRSYPYGDEFEADRCNAPADETLATDRELEPGGAREGCVTPEGVHDLSGNVGEWLSTAHPMGTMRATRGGNFTTYPKYAVCLTDFSPHYAVPEFSSEVLGFRCCADAN